jgi:signal transduction histidine kinase
MRWPSIVKRNPFVLPMAVVAGLAIFFISEGSYWQSLDTIHDLRGIASARQNLSNLERALADAETGQRGYLLTGRSDYLQPYQDGRRASQEALVLLDRHFKDDPAASALLAELRLLSQAKLGELEETVRLTKADQKAAAIQLVLSGAGKQNMDRVRVLIGQLMSEQTALRQSTNQALDRTLLLSRYGVAALSAVLMLALVLYLRKSDALANAQAAQKADLQSANDKLEAEVAQRTTQLTDLTRHLLTAREDERHRLARNLHDDLGSLLTAAKLDAARIRSRLGDAAPEAQARLADLVDKLNSSIALGRSIIEDLRPSTLGHFGLAATLGILGAEFSQRAGIPVHSHFEPVRLKPSVELVIYRVVQEAMTNLTKYAHAQQVWINLAPSTANPDQVTISVRDDGVGFDAHASSRSAFGLLGMRFRVEAEGGSLLVRSGPGQGTQIEVSLPALADNDKNNV